MVYVLGIDYNTQKRSFYTTKRKDAIKKGLIFYETEYEAKVKSDEDFELKINRYISQLRISPINLFFTSEFYVEEMYKEFLKKGILTGYEMVSMGIYKFTFNGFTPTS